MSLRTEFQNYLNRADPTARIDTEHSLGGKVQIRFELGDDLENGSQERVNQASTRAQTLFDATFPNQEQVIWVIVYEFQGENIYRADNSYLHQQFPSEQFDEFYNQLEMVNSRNIIDEVEGRLVFEQYQVRILIGKLPVKDINSKNILRGIANCEMGLNPAIDQRVYFFDPSSDKAFMMYDDRGCYVFGASADSIRDIYNIYNSWIVEYHRKTINKQFR